MRTFFDSDVEVIEEINNSGQATIYSAWLNDGSKKVRVALKIYHDHPDSRDCVLIEGSILAVADHSAIVKSYGCFFGRLGVGIVMEWLDHGSLARVIPKLSHFDQMKRDAVLQYVTREIISALAYLHHDLGVIHADLSPENIMVRDGGLVLIDFAASRHFSSRDQTVPFGKKIYLAPERFVDQSPPSFWSDLYSFGMIAKNIYAHPSDQVMSLVIKACCAPSPLDRPKSARFIKRMLGPCAEPDRNQARAIMRSLTES